MFASTTPADLHAGTPLRFRASPVTRSVICPAASPATSRRLRTARAFARLAMPVAISWAVSVAACPSAARADDGRAVTAGAKDPTQVKATGLAVVAMTGASDAAWTLAQKVYANPSLRPAALGEPEARALSGETPEADASTTVRDLADMRAAVKGDDAPSRAVLSSLAERLHVRGLVVVRGGTGETPTARVYVAETRDFDAAYYVPDVRSGSNAAPAAGASAAAADWTQAMPTLVRLYGPGAVQVAPAADGLSGVGRAEKAVADASREASQMAAAEGDAKVGRTSTSAYRSELDAKRAKAGADKGKPSKPFYTSPWFWGAIGAAAAGGTALYFATRDNDPSTIHLQMQVPK